MNAPPVDRRVLLSLLAAGAFAVAPHGGELPLWIIAVFALGGAWRYGIEVYQWYRPGKLVRFGLMLLTLVAGFRQYHTLLGRDPGMALLHVMQPAGIDMPARLRLSGVMLAKALPLMVIVYLLFPRISGTLWGLPADAHSGLTGMPDTMQPGSIRNLSESSEIAFRVSFAGSRPPARELYWRGLVLTETDGRGWRRGNGQTGGKVSFVPLADPVRYDASMEPSHKP